MPTRATASSSPRWITRCSRARATTSSGLSSPIAVETITSDAVLPQAELIHDRAVLQQAIVRMAGQIRADYAGERPLFLTVMHGGMPFAAQLAMEVTVDLEFDYLHATRYRNETSGGDLFWKAKPEVSFKEKLYPGLPLEEHRGTVTWVAPLKLASGCDRRCSFCAIPSFRGAFVSRRPADVLAEARWLAEDDPATLQNLADEYGVSAERIRQIEAAAMTKMKKALAAYA